jgi:hypothetical protein
MILYAIKDIESGLYVTRGFSHGLEKLGSSTLFFETRSDAMRLIEAKLGHDIEYTSLQAELAWNLLEMVYDISRWSINCSKEELQDAIDQFKNLKVVKLWLGEGE